MILWLGVLSVATAADVVTPAEQSDEGVKLGITMSYMLADKQGVPDAIRAGFSTGIPLVRSDRGLRLAIEPSVLVGYSEKDSWSVRAGANVEGGIWVEKMSTLAYVSTGLHFFRSYTEDETRIGPLWRSAIGLRFAAGGKGYVGFEPLAIERFPNGPGMMTPLRSRWGLEITMLQAGVWL